MITGDYFLSSSPYYFLEKHMGEERRIFILFNIVAKRVKGAFHHSELASPTKPILKITLL